MRWTQKVEVQMPMNSQIVPNWGKLSSQSLKLKKILTKLDELLDGAILNRGKSREQFWNQGKLEGALNKDKSWPCFVRNTYVTVSSSERWNPMTILNEVLQDSIAKWDVLTRTSGLFSISMFKLEKSVCCRLTSCHSYAWYGTIYVNHN